MKNYCYLLQRIRETDRLYVEYDINRIICCALRWRFPGWLSILTRVAARRHSMKPLMCWSLCFFEDLSHDRKRTDGWGGPNQSLKLSPLWVFGRHWWEFEASSSPTHQFAHLAISSHNFWVLGRASKTVPVSTICFCWKFRECVQNSKEAWRC